MLLYSRLNQTVPHVVIQKSCIQAIHAVPGVKVDPDLLHHCLENFLIKVRHCRRGSGASRVRAAARRQGQFHVCYLGILGHFGPMGWHWGSEGLVGMTGLLVGKGLLQKRALPAVRACASDILTCMHMLEHAYR